MMLIRRCDICGKEIKWDEVTEVRSGMDIRPRLFADLCPSCAGQCLHILEKRLKESAKVRKSVSGK